MKTQMKFQKILALISLIVAALAIVLSLCYCSGVLYECQSYTKLGIGADKLYDYSQTANNTLLILSIVLILVVVTLFITATNKRRNYYITNYVSLGLVILYTLVFAILLLSICSTTISIAKEIDYVKWKELYDEPIYNRFGQIVGYKNPRNYSESLVTPVLGIVLGVLLLVEVVAWVLNLIWKIKLMQGEKALLAKGVEVQQLEVA